MTTRTVRYCVTCTTEDPQSPARVMGLIAARSLVPLTFRCNRASGRIVLVDFVIEIEDEDCRQATHLARLLNRIPSVADVLLEVDGCAVPYRYPIERSQRSDEFGHVED